jgi:hypothetical protein
LLRLFLKLSCCSLLLLTAACASRTPELTANVADTGRKYAATLKQVNTYALDHALEFTADLLPGLPRDADNLQQHTEALRERALLVQAMAAYLDTQALYFAELDSLAKGDKSSSNARALRKLIEALNKGPAPAGIPGLAKEAVTGLAGQVSAWRHSDEVREVLTRDADLVASALLVNEQVLQQQIEWISQRETLARQVEYREKVLKPYVEDRKLNETWKKAWIGDIKRPPAIELLEQARAASMDMQQAWVSLLRGEGGLEHLQGALAQINSNLQAVVNHDRH